MIVVKEFPDRQFSNKQELFKAIVDNLPTLMNLKKSAIKFTDGFNLVYGDENVDKDFSFKQEGSESENLTEIKRKVVMNTTGLLDSHGDVHIKNIWKRSLDHNNIKLHLQEHKRDFDKVISDDAIASTKTMSWKSLGAEYEGGTQALIFDSIIKESRNSEMFKQYKNGWVKNHSVGMQYVDYHVCINSGEQWAKEYKENWEKYYDDIVNKEEADDRGWFWAVTEAKLIEGSAVLFGSNWVTPTLNNKYSESGDTTSDKTDSDNTTPPEVKKRRII